MNIEYYGANCFRFKTSSTQVIVDDNLAALGKKSPSTNEDVLLVTNPKLINTGSTKAKLTFDMPGDYEVGDIMIRATRAQAHTDEKGQQNAIMYSMISAEGLRLAVLGHVHPDLSDKQLESLGVVDVLLIPVGGRGYTLDAIGAVKLVKRIEPKIIIPTHYHQVGVNYDVPQSELDEFIKLMAVEVSKSSKTLKIKAKDLSEVQKVMVIEP